MPQDTPEQQAAEQFLADWGETLDELEENLRAAVRAFEALRAGIGGGAAAARLQVVAPRSAAASPVAREPEAALAAEPRTAAPATGPNGGAYAPFERLWERLEQERGEKQQPELEREEVRGLDLLPRQYLMTVEDRESTVDLIPLHRALQGLTGVQEISLVSFANGVPVVSIRTDRELNMEQLGTSVGLAMDRECEVIQQDNGRLFLRLKPAGDRGE
jgi:hypothetical protein